MIIKHVTTIEMPITNNFPSNKETSIWSYYWIEIKDRCFSSKHRIIKTCGMLMIPFVYAFICIAAFWNPLANIGSIPAAIVSLDKPRLVTVSFSDPNSSDKTMVIAPQKCEGPSGQIFDIPDNETDWKNWYDTVPNKSDWNLISSVLDEKSSGDKVTMNLANVGYTDYISLSDVFMNSWKNDEIPNFGYQNDKYYLHLSDRVMMKNVDYINGDDASKYATYDSRNFKWNVSNSKYFVEFNVPKILTTDFINYITASINDNSNPQDELAPLATESINFFVTYQKNYLTAEILDNFSSFMTAILNQSSDSISMGLINNIFDDLVFGQNSEYIWKYTGSAEIKTSSPLTIADTLSYDDNGAVNYYGWTGDMLFEPGHSYIIRNDEIRDELPAKDQTFWAKLSPNDQTNWLAANTFEGDTKDYPWNPTFPNSLPNNFIHLLACINNVCLSIPQVNQTLTTKLNNAINNIIQEKTQLQISLDIPTSSIDAILCNDQSLDAMLLQDNRFIKLDTTCTNIEIFGIGNLNIINYPQMLGLLAWPYDTDTTISIFHDLNISSLLNNNYGNNEWKYEDDNSSPIPSGHAVNPIGTIDFGNRQTPNIGSFVGNLYYDINSIINIENASSVPDINIHDFTSVDVLGSQHGQYGIGIGEMFLCIGLWVGAFSQTIIFDRKKRVTKIQTKKWYFAKTLIMFSASCVQTLILLMCVGLLGWFSLGGAFIYEWIFMMFVAMIFIIIIQSIWFSFRDKSLSMFFIVVFLVLNLASGWGTFPVFMQFDFFRIISYVMPFTYAIHAQGAIVYGISSGVNLLSNSLYVLEKVGILLIYGLVFGLNGLYQAKHREREMLYGGCNRKKISIALIALGWIQYLNNNQLVMWKSLPNEPMPELINKVRELFPFEKKYSWFKKQQSTTLIEDIEKFE